MLIPKCNKLFQSAALISLLMVARSVAGFSNFQVPTTTSRRICPLGVLANDAALSKPNKTISLDPQDCPPGYFLDTVHAQCAKLGPLGRISQVVETSFGPFKKASNAIINLFGIDEKKIANLGVTFALSYSIISHIAGSISLSIAWYMTCTRTGLSPLHPGQWKELLKSYGMIYAMIQLFRPFRVAAAIAMSKLSNEFLEITQNRFDCSRRVAIVVQFVLGLVMLSVCATSGVLVASNMAGVPLW